MWREGEREKDSSVGVLSSFSPVLCNPFLAIHSVAFAHLLYNDLFLSLLLLYPPSSASVPPLS